MDRYTIEQTYRKWWWGKKVRRVNTDNEFKRVVDIAFIAPPSGVYGCTWLIFDDGSKMHVEDPYQFRARKKDIEVLNT